MASHGCYDKSKLLNKPYKALHDVTFANIISLILSFLLTMPCREFFPLPPTHRALPLLNTVTDTVLSARNTCGLLLPLPGQVL